MVSEVASDLHDAWLKKPCWRALARHILAEPEEQPKQCCSKATSLDGILNDIFGPPIDDPDTDFRLVDEGEEIEFGDQWLSGGVWRDMGESHVIGMTVQAPSSCSLPYGHYRRPLALDVEEACGNFGWALSMLHEGLAVRSKVWVEDMKIALCPGDEKLLPVILLFDGDEVGPFFPDHKDLLATDWTLA